MKTVAAYNEELTGRVNFEGSESLITSWRELPNIEKLDRAIGLLLLEGWKPESIVARVHDRLKERRP
jgi:hypothetical protein